MQTPDATLELGDAAAQRQNALLAQTPSLIQELGSLLHSNNQIANPQWLKSILEVTAKYFPLTDAGIITLFDKTTGFDEVVADYIKDDSLYMNIHLRTFEGTTKTCYENMESRIINNENRPLGFIDDDELLSREELFKEILKPDFLYSSVMCCPLQFDGQILGAIQLEHSGNDNSFSEFELQVLDHLVAHPLAEVLYRYGLSDFICHRNREISAFFRHAVFRREGSQSVIASLLSRDVAQTLSGVKLGLSNMENDLTKLEHGEELSQYYSELKESVNQALASTNNLIYLYGSELLVEHELIDSIETILNLHVTPTGIAAHLDAEDFDEDLLSPDIIQCLFNIAHQALENVIEHSEARNVYVGLSTSNDRAVMVINDDGKGFSARDLTLEDQPCFGFSGMSERLAMCNGSFLVTSQKGNGTKVTAIIPLCETEGCL